MVYLFLCSVHWFYALVFCLLVCTSMWENQILALHCHVHDGNWIQIPWKTSHHLNCWAILPTLYILICSPNSFMSKEIEPNRSFHQNVFHYWANLNSTVSAYGSRHLTQYKEEELFVQGQPGLEQPRLLHRGNQVWKKNQKIRVGHTILN